MKFFITRIDDKILAATDDRDIEFPL